MMIEPKSRHAGTIISEALIREGKTQTWLAHKCDVSNNAVTKWVRTGQISKNNALRVAEVLNLKVEELLSPDSDRSNMARMVADSLNVDISELPTILIHVTPKELRLLNRYRQSTAQSRVAIESVINMSHLDPEHDQGGGDGEQRH
jgi:hypothetical protein